MKSEMRWTDREKFFWVWTCIKPNLVLSEISEMKRWRVRWRDEQMKMFFGSEHVSSQIWCYLKLVRWRDEEWDEEMKFFFSVWTCIKPNLVLSEISEMKSEIKRWTDKEIFFGSEHVSSQIWCYLKLVRWRDEDEMNRWTDENFFGSEHVSSQIWCYLKLVRWRDEEWDEQMNRWRKFFWVQTCIKSNLVLSEISEMKRWRVRWRDEEMKKKFWGPNMYQAKSGVIWN